MFPVGDDNTGRRLVPYITYLLILINVGVFFIELTAGEQFIYTWSLVPQRFLSNPVGDFLTIITSMFMHAGWLHIIGNMLYLFVFGDNVEDSFGHGKFLLFYLICGVTATFAQLAFNASSTLPNLGASGAIAGVLGAYIFMFPTRRVRVLMGFFIIPLPALVVIGLWIILQIYSGIGSILSTTTQSDGVAYLAHIGGFFIGLALTPLFRNRPRRIEQ